MDLSQWIKRIILINSGSEWGTYCHNSAVAVWLFLLCLCFPPVCLSPSPAPSLCVCVCVCVCVQSGAPASHQLITLQLYTLVSPELQCQIMLSLTVTTLWPHHVYRIFSRLRVFYVPVFCSSANALALLHSVTCSPALLCSSTLAPGNPACPSPGLPICQSGHLAHITNWTHHC